jgi:hypothetical protein
MADAPFVCVSEETKRLADKPPDPYQDDRNDQKELPGIALGSGICTGCFMIVLLRHKWWRNGTNDSGASES